MLKVCLLTSYTRNVEYPLRTSPPSRWSRPSSPPRARRRGTCTGRWRSAPRPPSEAASSRTCPDPRTRTAAGSATSRWPGSCCPCSWSCFSQTPWIVSNKTYVWWSYQDVLTSRNAGKEIWAQHGLTEAVSQAASLSRGASCVCHPSLLSAPSQSCAPGMRVVTNISKNDCEIFTWGNSGGRRLKKKSLTAVATAFTAMSRDSMLNPGSSSNFWKMRSTCALNE